MVRAAGCASLSVAWIVGSVGRVDEYSDADGLGYHLMQDRQLLRHKLRIEKIDTRQVAARPGEARDKTEPDGVFAGQQR